MIRRAVMLALLVTGAGCSEPKFALPTSSSDSTSTTTTTTVTATTQSFTGTLDVRTQRFYSFLVPSARTVTVTLEQLQTGAGTTSTLPVTLGLGVPQGTGCALLSEIAAMPSDAPALTESLAAGVYCASVADPGNLTEPLAFSIRIDLP